VRFGTITNKDTLYAFRLKFRQTNSLFEIETLTTEHPEVGNIGLVSGEDFIWSLVQALAEVEPV
jgi:hypothetical protein